jgi:glycosyltransferase involved in cell wall biosynthesis
MIIPKYKLIVVTPVYEDVEASGRLFKELKAQFNKEIFLVAVDDGSIMKPLQIESLNNANIDGVILKLKRNVGHQKAIAIALGYVSDKINAEQLVVVMDSDGEDLPSTVPVLIDLLKEGDVDVVMAQRKSRVETFKFKLFYEIYKRIFKALTGRAISFGNFMAMNHDAVMRLATMQELSIHIAAAVLASKLRTKVYALDRGPRYAGQSKMNFVGLVLHGFKALMVFAEDVLVRVGIASAIIASLALFATIATILLKIIGFSTPGWFSIALGILVLILMQMGLVALMTLMLLGVVRSGAVNSKLDYEIFIDRVFKVGKLED